MPAFPTTHWSLIHAAGHGDRQAMGDLCGCYWAPLYTFARRSGADPEEAKEQVQDFLASFATRNDFARVSDENGRFRSYLLRAFRNHNAKAHARATAQKRGGGATPMRWQDVEAVYAASSGRTPEEEFERQWARELVERARQRVRLAYARRPALFQALFPLLSHGTVEEPYAQIGERLSMSEGAVKVAAHRLRRRFRDALRAEVLETVANPLDVDSELRHLMKALG